MTTLLKDNVKSGDLTMVGYFYKQNTPEGFAWFQSEGDGELWNITIEQHHKIVKCFDDTMNYIQLNGTDLKKFQSKTKKRCESYIKEFQTKVGYPNGKPTVGEMAIEITREVMLLINMINIQIYFMTEWGTLKNDEYNGMSYVYKNIQFK